MLGSAITLGKKPIDLDIHNTWIDRDTYQKTFDVLSREAVISRRTELLGESIVLDEYKREENSSLKVVISGFYYEEDDTLVIPKIKVRKTKLLTPSVFSKIEDTELSVLTFHLKEGKSLLQKIKRPVIEMEFKTLYKDKPPQKEPFEFSPFMAVFKLPENYEEKQLQIDVLNPKGEKIYTAPIQKIKNREQGELGQIDKIQ